MKTLSLLVVSACLVASCGDDTQSQPAAAGEPTTHAGADWATFGLDLSNSVNNRAEAVLAPDNVSELVEAWRIDGSTVTGTPILVDDVVYFADWEGTVHAVDSQNGSTMWATRVADVPISSTVAVTDDLVVAGDLGGVLHALDRQTGASRWSTNLNPQGASLFASPVVIEDAVVIGMTDSETAVQDSDFRASIVAINLEDGSEIWRLYTDPGDVPERWVTIWSSAAYDPDLGLIYVGTGNTNQGSGGDEDSTTDLPLADGVLAIDRASGEIAWFFKLIEEDRARDLDVGASPNLFSIDGRDVVGVGGKSGDYVVLDRETGEMIWKTNLTNGSALGGVMSTAAIGEGVIYVASNQAGSAGTIFALDAGSGSILWQQQFGPPIVGSMALANGVLYRGTFSPAPGTVMALDAEDGTVLWTDEVDGALGGGFSIAGGTLYVGYGVVGRGLDAAPGGLIAYRLP